MRTMAARAREFISSAGSTASLDIQAILSSYPGESLLSTRLSFSSTSDSSHSFDAIPFFPAGPRPFALAKSDCATPVLYPRIQRSSKASSPVCDISPPLATLPTAPRLNAMLMEKLSVFAWAESVSLSSDSPTVCDQDAADVTIDNSPLRIAERFPISPEKQPASLYSYTCGSPKFNNPHATESIPDFALLYSRSLSISPVNVSNQSIGSLGDPSICSGISGRRTVPIIMVSNSTAALPLPLESSSTLHRDVPLAVRRGKKPPPVLSLGQPLKEHANSLSQVDSYPDIPSAFLGSPTSCSPTSPLFSGEPSKFDMGLSAMCSSLKALVPPPPFTPTEADHFSRAQLEPEPETRWGMVTSARLPDADDEEWAFVQDLVIEWHESKGCSAEISPPISPIGDLPYTVIGSSDAATFKTSLSTPPEIQLDPNNTSAEEVSVQTEASVKQMRRKTVIIEAPESELQTALEQATKADKVEKLCNTAGDTSVHLLPDEFDEPVPFEMPVSTPGPRDSTSTPSSSRPSSMSSAKLPVRGILKEKKSVRFSAVPSLREFEKHEEIVEHGDAVPPRPPTPGPPTPSQPNSESPKRAPLTAAPYRSSPLRTAHISTASDGIRTDEDMVQREVATPSSSARMKALPSVPPLILGGRGAAPNLPKHPVARAMARHQSPNRVPVPPVLLVGSGVGGAVIGAPSLVQPPTPALLEEQRLAPLKSLNVGQNMPVERKPDHLVPVKCTPITPPPGSARKGARAADKENVGRRVFRAVSVPATPKRDREGGAASVRRLSDELAKEACGGAPAPAHLGVASPQKNSRMPVPLRSIFTKLRT